MASSSFLLIIVAFAFLYFVLVRPQRRRQSEQARLLGSLAVGDEVVTAGGIYGHITSIEGDDLMVEIAPQLEVRVARRSIGGVVKSEPNEPEETQLEQSEPEEPAEPPVAEDGG